MSGRKSGTTNDRFDPEALTNALKPLAELKKPACDFEFEQYGKTRRSQGPDRDGLEYYEPLLLIILQFAARALPLKAHLKIVWLQLQDDYLIKSKRHENKTKADWVDMCVDRITTACSHLRSLAQSRTVYVSNKLKSLMALVDIGEDVCSTTTTIASPSARAPITTPSPSARATSPRPTLRRSLQVQFSDASSCAICSIECKCEDCNKPEVLSLISPNLSPAKSETSNAAEGNQVVVPADRGGQKRAAQDAKDAAKEAKDAAKDAAKEEPVAKKSRRGKVDKAAKKPAAKKPARAEASSNITGAS